MDQSNNSRHFVKDSFAKCHIGRENISKTVMYSQTRSRLLPILDYAELNECNFLVPNGFYDTNQCVDNNVKVVINKNWWSLESLDCNIL
jgi:hypothetical protein